MKGHLIVHILSFCALAVLLLALFPPGAVLAQAPSDAPEPLENYECLACHQATDAVITFPSGESLSVFVDTYKYGGSVHKDLDCVSCHPGIQAYPHPAVSAPTLEAYRLSYHESCKTCHQEQFDEVAMSVHEELFEKGVEGTPLCADCHQPHSQKKLCNPDGAITFEDRLWIAETCAACHAELYATYENSTHGKGLVEDHNVDMPTCIDCHDVHKICSPNEVAFRINSLEMCASCHANPKMMDKYGQDVNVLNTYVVFHDTTVTMLEKYDPEEMSSKPTCYDCHGIHDVGNNSNPPTAVFDLPATSLYPPVEQSPQEPPARNIAVTGALLGFLAGSAGTLTVAQLVKESKKENKPDQ